MITIRQAQLDDVPQMLPVLDEYARQAEILPRTEDDVYRTIREWAVAETPNGQVVGMGALSILWRDLAEVRSLVIDPHYQGQRVGQRVVEQLIDQAKTLRIPMIFALTRKPGFFLKLGFQMTRIEYLPRKIQRDCVFCPKFHRCDEVAVIMPLDGRDLLPEEAVLTAWNPELLYSQQPRSSSPPFQSNGDSPQPIIPLNHD